MIPKVIYQTWKTKDLHPAVQEIRQNMQDMNHEYQMILFDDNDMDRWIVENCDQQTIKAYQSLQNGAGRADFWRYLVIYQNGGVYLDIDSEIKLPLRELIDDDDSAIITREKNENMFNQWILIFEKNHPVLKKTIEKVIF